MFYIFLKIILIKYNTNFQSVFILCKLIKLIYFAVLLIVSIKHEI